MADTTIDRPLTSSEQSITQAGDSAGQDASKITGTNYAGFSKPVTSLSSENAIGSLNNSFTKLNDISPTTAPGAIKSPYVDPSKGGTAAPAPKAFFANQNGQEAEYTDAQLKDPATQKFLQDNGYAMVKTEGPQYNPLGTDSSALTSDIKSLTDNISKIADNFNSYNVDNDPAFQSQANNIKSQFQTLIDNMNQSNNSRLGALETLGYRTGSTQYSGPVQMGIEGTEIRQANQRISDLVTQESSAISAARQAWQTGKWSQFQNQMTALDKVRTAKSEELKAFNDKLAAINKNYQDTFVRSSRDSAIADLLTKGITDPSEIIKTLNAAGGKFTSKEVGDTLKNINDNSGIKNLTGNVKDFYELKKEGNLPSSISSQPEGQQLKSWLQYVSPKNIAGVGVVNKITLSEAKFQNLPLSVVGMSEQDIAQSFGSNTPPEWFIEKLQGEKKQSIDATGAQTAWGEYRDAYNNNRGTVSTADKAAQANTTKASSYFKSTYGDGISDEDIKNLADRVQTYINGGKTYAAAVKQVEDEAQ